MSVNAPAPEKTNGAVNKPAKDAKKNQGTNKTDKEKQVDTKQGARQEQNERDAVSAVCMAAARAIENLTRKGANGAAVRAAFNSRVGGAAEKAGITEEQAIERAEAAQKRAAAALKKMPGILSW